MATFPQNSFWDYSLSVYSRPRVADACIFLQDRYGLDVNLLLFCLWTADSGRQALDPSSLRDCNRRIRDWRARVIEPLRAIRRACRAEPLGVPEFLLEASEPSIQKAELDAERVEQLILADAVRHQSQEPVDDSIRATRANQNLWVYADLAANAADEQLEACLRTLFAAAFPGQDFAAAD